MGAKISQMQEWLGLLPSNAQIPFVIPGNNVNYRSTPSGFGSVSTVAEFDWSVLNILNAPTGSEVDGDSILVGTAGTGDFATHNNQIGEKVAGVWTFSTATAGDLLYNVANDNVYKFNGTTWDLVGKASIHQGGDRFGAPMKIGPLDYRQFNFITNNIIRFHITRDGVYKFYTLSGAEDGLMGLDTLGVASNVQIGTGLALTGGVLSAEAGFGDQDLQEVTDIGKVTTNGSTWGNAIFINDSTIFNLTGEGTMSAAGDTGVGLVPDTDVSQTSPSLPSALSIPNSTIDHLKIQLTGIGEDLNDRLVVEFYIRILCDGDGFVPDFTTNQASLNDATRVKVIEQTGRFISLAGDNSDFYIAFGMPDPPAIPNTYFLGLIGQFAESFSAKYHATVIRSRLTKEIIPPSDPLADPDIAYRFDNTSENSLGNAFLELIGNAPYGLEIERSVDTGSSWDPVTITSGNDPGEQSIILDETYVEWGTGSLMFRTRAIAGGGFDPSNWITIVVPNSRSLGFDIVNNPDGTFSAVFEDFGADTRICTIGSEKLEWRNESTLAWTDVTGSQLTGSIPTNPSAGSEHIMSYNVGNTTDIVKFTVPSSFTISALAHSSSSIDIYFNLLVEYIYVQVKVEAGAGDICSLFMGVNFMCALFIDWGDGSPVLRADDTTIGDDHAYASAGTYHPTISVRQPYTPWYLDMTAYDPTATVVKDIITDFEIAGPNLASTQISAQKLTTSVIDMLLQNAVDGGLPNGYFYTSGQIPAAPPSSSTNSDILIGLGWDVITD